MAQIDQKTDRLISVLAGSGDLTMPYIDRAIRKLEFLRQELLERQAGQHAVPHLRLKRLEFAPLELEEKKLVAAQFIWEIRLSGETAEAVWDGDMSQTASYLPDSAGFPPFFWIGSIHQIAVFPEGKVKGFTDDLYFGIVLNLVIIGG